MTDLSALRILFCVTDLEMGGAERALVELVCRISADRFAPVVVSLAPPPRGSRGVLVKRLETAEIPLEFLNARSSLQTPRVIWQFWQLCRRYRPQILQSFLFHANVLAAVGGTLAGVPHVVAGIRVAERRSHFKRWLTRYTAPWVSRHVCVSEAVASFSQGAENLSQESLVVIPNGVDLNDYAACQPVQVETLGVASGRKIILYGGRLTEQKRVDWLLDRMPDVFERLPDYDLVLAGQGETRPYLEEQARHLRIEDRVHFLGWREDFREILAGSQLLVLTSLWEGMPTVVLEAMASSKPVVVTEVEGITELLGVGVQQQQVEVGDTNGFVDRVVAIASDNSLAVRLGRQNRERVQANFTLEKAVSRYEALYRSLASC